MSATTASNATTAAATAAAATAASALKQQITKQPASALSTPQRSSECEGDACSLKPRKTAAVASAASNSTISTTQRTNTNATSACSVYSPICQQVASASFGAMITSLCMTPLDVIRTRLQVQHKSSFSQAVSANTVASSRNYYYTGTLDAIAKISKTEGVRGLWRGLTPSLAMQIPASGLYVVSVLSFKLFLC